VAGLRDAVLAVAFTLIVGYAVPERSVSATAVGATTSTAFVDVNVIAMDREEVRAHQTVLVEGERIVAMGPADVINIPRQALRIRGTGRYLIPGLIDMHVHFVRRPSEAEPPEIRHPDYRERNEDFGLLFVANGVTSVRLMHAHPAADELRARSMSDAWLGPAIYSTGPITDGDPPAQVFARALKNPAEAIRAVADDKAAGYVGIKVYDFLSLPLYEAIVAAAAEARLDVVGHVPDQVGLQRAIEAHQATIEHFDAFLPSLQPGTGPYVAPPADYKMGDLLSHADLSKLPAFADALRRDGIWTCPTVVVTQFDSSSYAASDEMRYIPAAFAASLHRYFSARPAEAELSFALDLVKMLHERGAGLLLGTDALIVVPGFSAIQELEYFVRAGLTPYEALQTGTINAARALHEQGTIGSIDVGKRADLILLEANPLANVHNIGKRAGVLLRGRWLPENELQDRLSTVARAVSATTH
jgi:cytosine/adenosine deaminase-related metal-dependent hydrolase